MGGVGSVEKVGRGWLRWPWQWGPAAIAGWLACAVAYGAPATPRDEALAWGNAGFQTLVQAQAQAQTGPDEARAFWLNRRLIQWPQVQVQTPGKGRFRLYHSAQAQLVAHKGDRVRGADGHLALTVFRGRLAKPLQERFAWLPMGARLQLPAAQLGRMPRLLKGQLMIVQEDPQGRVQDATSLQVAGALDDWYAAAAEVPDLGVTLKAGTQFKLWAPTAQKVWVYTYPDAQGAADAVLAARFDAATGVWVASAAQDLSGKTYRYAVEVVVRGVGRVRNLVTDPYSVALTANGQRSGILRLSSPTTQPAGWAASQIPATVAAPTDMSIYELHVRDFSANDPSVSAARRGKYLAFTEADSLGMRHLRALAQAGLTDVQLLPIFDFSSVPELGCRTPSPSGAAASAEQQGAVAATQAEDCYNWGYDPQHFNAPEGSFASDPNDLTARVRELRQMVMGLHAAGLRVAWMWSTTTPRTPGSMSARCWTAWCPATTTATTWAAPSSKALAAKTRPPRT